MKAILTPIKDHLRFAVTIIVILFSFVSLNAQLDGTYRLGPADSSNVDFTSWSELADTLNSDGINDSVVINVLPHNYEDVHITFTNVTGTAADKWIVFQSSTGDSSDVSLSYNYPNNA